MRESRVDDGQHLFETSNDRYYFEEGIMESHPVHESTAEYFRMLEFVYIVDCKVLTLE